MKRIWKAKEFRILRRMLKVLNHLLIFLFFGGWREGLDTFNVIVAHALHFDITDLK